MAFVRLNPIIGLVAKEMFPERGVRSIVFFNDHDDTVFEEIEQVLEKTIIKLRE